MVNLRSSYFNLGGGGGGGGDDIVHRRRKTVGVGGALDIRWYTNLR